MIRDDTHLQFLQLTVLQFLERHTDHRNLDGIYTDVYCVAYGKMFWSSEARVSARFHYAES